MKTSSFFFIIATCVSTVVMGLPGCSSSERFEEEPVKAHLRQIARAHASIVSYSNRPIKDMDEMRASINDLHLLDLGAPPEEAMVSPRDHQPFEILLGAGPSEPGDAILAYEKEGVDGKRWVVTVGSELKMLTNEEFSKAKFVKDQKPAGIK
jgi:hypothetical protein